MHPLTLDLHRFGPPDPTTLPRLTPNAVVLCNLVHARSLVREINQAEQSNPLVKEVIQHLAESRRYLEVAVPRDKAVDATMNARGFTGLYLTGEGFRIHDGKAEGVMGAMRSLMATVIHACAGPSSMLPYGEGIWLMPSSARLRHFNVTFSEIMDRVREMADMIPDQKQRIE